MDPLLFLTGVIRVAIWIWIALIGYRHHVRLLALGAGLAAANATVFAVSNAGGQVPDPLFKAAALAATPGTLAPAFDPQTPAYTLAVPVGTEEVDLDLDPHVASGLVRVDGVLIDDSRPRTVDLAADGPTTVAVCGPRITGCGVSRGGRYGSAVGATTNSAR